jgi:propionate CoA-transferase
MTLTAEPGVIGGLPAGGLNFGAASNTEAIINHPEQFDFYDGGGLDLAVLGSAQIDAQGNVNVSKFGSRLVGMGGFINISQNTKKVCFVGSFTAGDFDISIKDGKLHIAKDGAIHKFVKQVEHITFSGKYAVKKGQTIYYVTERCVFKLVPEGIELIEVAPGVDIEKDILAHMDFKPIIKNPTLMDGRIFHERVMGMKDDMFKLPLESRFSYDAKENVFFINFEGLSVKTTEDIGRIRSTVDKMLSPLGKKVFTIVNYDNFTLAPDLADEYAAMVKYVMDKYYLHTTRYSTNAFQRMKLGDTFSRRSVSPDMHDSKDKALKALKH